ncbi:hypothetical protein K469DRAFT_713954 [Zopfia rhizophila CBS 207.26]|uniref:Uncharacterized protein n=1 Tax=Zopfia rhizophila CBS 207.26 TaxID=1314779 RepID=A0A6A6DQ22_9PEZI|nr:hypothetical protein K469DRAFT_713954 [Zopfia rhizophila CBS 207.26]
MKGVSNLNSRTRRPWPHLHKKALFHEWFWVLVHVVPAYTAYVPMSLAQVDRPSSDHALAVGCRRD